jgi:DNA-binding winged helix-turn-helix (wHTH) protein
MSGVVKDVIKNILEKNGPLTKEEIIDKVMKERYVKENTIMVNLQNQKHFKKTKDGKYDLIEVKVVA